jgi:hypothetical protein
MGTIIDPAERFGGDSIYGQYIVEGCPGKGFASIPWALDDYERKLGLSISESWLLRKMIKHNWFYDEPVFLSMKKITRDAIVSSATLNTDLKKLQRKGYIAKISNGDGLDRRGRYLISGLMRALAYSKITDKNSTICNDEYFDYQPIRTAFSAQINAILKEHSDVKINSIADINGLFNSFGQFIWWGTLKICKIPQKFDDKNVKIMDYIEKNNL